MNGITNQVPCFQNILSYMNGITNQVACFQNKLSYMNGITNQVTKLAECDQPGENLLKYSAMAGNLNRATGRTVRFTHFPHWPILTDWNQ